MQDRSRTKQNALMGVPKNMREILLTQGKFALVDDEDFDRMNRFKWFAHHIHKNWYAVRDAPTINKIRGERIYLHRFLMPGHKEIDHINGDGLNNQKNNLRPATHQQNLSNRKKHSEGSSKYKGVSWSKCCRCWRAQIRLQRQQLHLGCYESETDAAFL